MASNPIQTIASFWPVIPLLGIVIFFHELGHFLAAKWRKVTVLKFSLGMGPEMIGFTHGGTRYCLSWIPLGGFVQMAGDTLQDDGSLPQGGREQFLTHPWYGRIVIAVAGPAANLVTAYFVVLVTLLTGVSQPDFTTVIGKLAPESKAYAAGLREDDHITHLGGAGVTRWHELIDGFTAPAAKAALTVGVDRAGQPMQITVPAGEGVAWLRELEPKDLPLPIAGMISPGMPAYRAGVKEGDRVLAIDGQPVEWFHEIRAALKGHADKPVRFTLERDGKPFDLTIRPMRADPENPDSPDGQIGISAPRALTWTQRFPFQEAVPGALKTTGGMVVSVYKNLWLTITRPFYYREAVGGPVFIGQMARESARQGLDSFLWLLAMINLAIMSFNLLPIPLLDGGHITLALLEGIRRRAVSGRAYINFQKVGLVFVGTLFLFIMSQDLVRPILRMRAVDQAPRETTTVAPTPQ